MRSNAESSGPCSNTQSSQVYIYIPRYLHNHTPIRINKTVPVLRRGCGEQLHLLRNAPQLCCLGDGAIHSCLLASCTAHCGTAPLCLGLNGLSNAGTERGAGNITNTPGFVSFLGSTLLAKSIFWGCGGMFSPRVWCQFY